MPGPTTESLSTDFKDLSRDLASSRADFATFREDSAGFRGRVETELNLIRWVGVFIGGILTTLAGSIVWLTWHASALNSRVETMEKTSALVVERLDKIVERLDKIDRSITTPKAQNVAP